jgi:hypothetical protein
MAFTGGPIPFIGVSTSDLTTNALSPILNVGLSQVLGGEISAMSGANLFSGLNFLKSQITPLITTNLSQSLNQTVQRSLSSVGPLGPVLSQSANQLASQAGITLTNLVGGFGGGGQGFSKAFPGAGDEPAANYGDSVYTLGTNGPDVVFSIVLANNGAQENGLQSLTGQGGSIPISVNSNTVTNAAQLKNVAINNAKMTIMTEQGTALGGIPENVG